MKIAIVGDVHSSWDLLSKIEAELILLTGDAGFIFQECKEKEQGHLRIPKKYPEIGNLHEYRDGKKKFLTDVIMIAGNHDCYLCLEKFSIPGLTWLKSGEMINYAKAEEEKITISGLGGCYSPKDYVKDWNQLSIHHKRHFTKAQLEKCLEHEADILLLHDGPQRLFAQYGLEHFGCEHLNELIELQQPAFAFCGHYHRYAEGKIGRTKLYALPRAEDGWFELDSEQLEGKFQNIKN